ncbi:hypothetical protein [Frigoriglobus tundricola]|uniref:Uncharacterized protein n=1 Tax=Frigoriglobus tundricola TaxID=2774151 RepID=A0A6M5Z301_9BACT|nr:hypothetical protein [Frigoriglobus tundricola]QJW99582.1 hypothetical protein FTUN_7194 [Frigoriglobus tundricola]
MTRYLLPLLGVLLFAPSGYVAFGRPPVVSLTEDVRPTPPQSKTHERFPIRLAAGAELAIGYFDSETQTYYAWRGVKELPPEDFPETFGAFARGLPLDLDKVRVAEVDLPVVYLRGGDGKHTPGYYEPVYKRFFAWKTDQTLPAAALPARSRVLVTRDVVRVVPIEIPAHLSKKPG